MTIALKASSPSSSPLKGIAKGTANARANAALLSKLTKDKIALMDRIERVRESNSPGSDFLAREETARDYSDVLEARRHARVAEMEQRREDRELDIRLKRFGSVSQFPTVKDTSYPAIAPGTTTTFAKHDDASSGPFDEVEWGPKGRLWEFNRRAHSEAQPMTRLVFF